MSIGISATKSGLDALTGETAKKLHDALRNIKDIQIYLVATSQADLNALGYTDTEVSIMKSAYTDLDKLRQIFEGTQTQSPAYDFRTFVKLLWGFGA